MSVRTYLPSTQFATMAVALAVSGGLVLGAQYITRPRGAPAIVASTTADSNADWQQTLAQIQAASGSTLPPAPSASTTQALLAAAQSTNLTDTVARSLFVNLGNQEGQGLGSDAPTQDALVAQAVSSLPAAPPASYAQADLTVVADSKANLHAYGNAVMTVFGAHTGATSQATLGVLAKAADSGSAGDLAPLGGIEAQYEGLATDLSKIAVPQSLVPLQLQALNDVAGAAASFEQMKLMTSDPLRALQGLQLYQNDISEAGRVFTTIARELNTDGILFTKDEPGSAWSGFLSTSQ